MTRLLAIGLLATAWLASLSMMACGGRVEAEKIGAAAAGAVNFDIDPNPTGNTPSMLGTVEDCVRIDGSGGFDSVADVTIDVVVEGDTQKPLAYDAWVIYESTKVDPVSWNDLIKLPGATPMTSKAPPQLNAGAIYFAPPGSGIAGDGTIVRLDLDVDFTTGPTTATFSFAKGAYRNSASQAHPMTTGTGMLAINQNCPAVTPTPTPGTPTATSLPTPPPGTIMLVSGWNNVCYVGPEQLIEDALADVAEHVLAVYRMRADQGFDTWFPNNPKASSITTVSPYQPLFILMSQYAFWPHEPVGTPPTSVPLASGWNSVCYTGQTKSAEEATVGVAGGFGIMYQLGSDQGWSWYVPGGAGGSNIVQLSQYDTVLILVNQQGDTTWTFDP